MGKLLCLTIVLLLVNLVDVIAVQQVTIQPPTSIHDDGVGVMPDEQLFHSLNLNLPQLKTVKSYFESNNIPAAKSALVEYLKSRTYPQWYYDPLHPNKSTVTPDVKNSNLIVQGQACIIDICYNFPSGSLFNWSFNPTYNNPHVAFDPEWQWQLGRMPWWSTLGSTWWGTNNSVYAQTFVDQMASWVNSCPVPANVNNDVWSSWRTIEAGIRMGGSWPDAYNRFLTSPQFNVSAVILMLKSFLDHGNYLYKFHTSGNWETMEMNGLFTVGALFPEFANASIWRKYAAQQLYELSKEDFLPDGMWNELTTGYMQVSISNIQALFVVAKVTNTSSDVPTDFVAILQKAYEYNVKIMCPIGDLPYVNDAWENNVVSLCKNGLELFPDNPYLVWAASNRVKGSAPSFTSIFLNSSNYIAMRSGWGFTDNYALFDVAALGARHYHQDKLNLLIDAYGRRLLYDGGGGEYEDSKFRDFAIDTPSHNTVLVDGLPQRRTVTNADPLGYGNSKTPPPVWQTNATFDYAAGHYIDNFGSKPIASHRREVLFSKKTIQLFVVVDTLVPTDTNRHNYTALWNLLSTKYEFDATHAVYTTDASKANLAVVPLLTTGLSVAPYVAVNKSSELWGWDVDRNPPFQIPALEILHSKAGTGPQQIVTLLLPLMPNQAYPIKSIKSSSPNIFLIIFDGANSVEVTIGPNNDGGINVRYISN
jgi:hypothetical protein